VGQCHVRPSIAALARTAVRRVEMRGLDLTKTVIIAPAVAIGSLGLFFWAVCHDDCMD
jgi:hypothetical protein